MNSRKAQIRKHATSIQGHATHQYSRPGEKPNWLMLIINFILQILTAILADWKGRKRRLGR